MIPTILIVSLALYWLLRESDYLRVRLLTGVGSVHDGKARTMAQWEEHDKIFEKELAQERKEYADKQAFIKSHTCYICKKNDDNLLIETKTFTFGNNVSKVTGCSECIEKYRVEIEKAYNSKPRKPVIKTAQMPLFIESVRIGSHTEIDDAPYLKHPIRRIVTDWNKVYNDCLPGKEWVKAHEHDLDDYEPTIELIVNDKTLSVNGNYRKGMIKEFVKANEV